MNLMETVEQPMLQILDVTEISAEDLYEENKEYNPAEWRKTIDRIKCYKDCVFYKALPQRGYAYVQYFAKYQVDDGLILFKSIGYHAMLTNNPFVRISIYEGIVRRFLLTYGDGKYFRAANTPKNREVLIKMSQENGYIWSNEF